MNSITQATEIPILTSLLATKVSKLARQCMSRYHQLVYNRSCQNRDLCSLTYTVHHISRFFNDPYSNLNF